MNTNTHTHPHNVARQCKDGREERGHTPPNWGNVRITFIQKSTINSIVVLLLFPI